MLRLLRDYRIWLLAFAIFIIIEFTYGCGPLRWTEKGVRLEQKINEVETLNVKCSTDIITSWECRSYYKLTF